MAANSDTKVRIGELWLKLQACSESIRQKCCEAQIELRLLAEYEYQRQTTAQFRAHNNDNTTVEETRGLIDPSIVPQVRLTPMDTATLADVWTDWKYGRDGFPSIESVENKFGKRSWVGSDPSLARQRALWSKIVQEIELHLAHGRKLSEIIVAGDCVLVKAGGIEGLARAIQENQESGLPTLFDPNQQSSDTEPF